MRTIMTKLDGPRAAHHSLSVFRHVFPILGVTSDRNPLLVLMCGPFLRFWVTYGP
jgi:hypothetical protein